MTQALPRSIERGSDETVPRGNTLAINVRAERALRTANGHFLLFGWVADEGFDRPRFELICAQSGTSFVAQSILRHSRPDVEAVHGALGHDFGFLVHLKLDAEHASGLPLLLGFSANGQNGEAEVVSEPVSERRLLEDLLAFLGSFQSYRGREATIRSFLSSGGRSAISDLNQSSQRDAARVQYVESFGAARAGPSFQTVLFGDVSAAMFQPLLFAKSGVHFGEWVYACNSPELADELMRKARAASNLYDLPIKVVLLAGNAGFGGANNVVMQFTSSRQVLLINPDVHPSSVWGDLLNRAIQPECFTDSLRGGLLFYDDEMLMHGGMYLDEDVHVSAGGVSIFADGAPACRLLRVEHYDKGVPFMADEWARRRTVPAVTGALMAFDRGCFESIGGFSSDFVYGHYEDADLCLRWADRVGPVEVDPDIRLVHLEGQGSKTRLPHFHGAAIVNRHIFDARNRHFAEADRLSASIGPNGV